MTNQVLGHLTEAPRGYIDAPVGFLFRDYFRHIAETVEADDDGKASQRTLSRRELRSGGISSAAAALPDGDLPPTPSSWGTPPPAQAMATWSIACWGMDGTAGGADAYTVATLQAAAAAAAQAVSAGA